jgi:hypothetical protein
MAGHLMKNSEIFFTPMMQRENFVQGLKKRLVSRLESLRKSSTHSCKKFLQAL